MAVLQYTSTTDFAVIASVATAASLGSVSVDSVSTSAPSPYDLPREISLPTRDFDLFVAALEQDVPPSPNLIRAAEAFKRKRR